LQEAIMNILDVIMNTQNGAALEQLGSQFGLNQSQTASALSALVPALAGGIHRNIQGEGGLADLMSAVSAGNHSQYLDDPQSLGGRNAVDDGNGILGHVLGSKDASRELASRAAAQTGLSTDVLKSILPLAASLMMGAISKNAQNPPMPGTSSPMTSGLAAPGATAGGGLLDMLTPLLDRNRDGSVIDDVSAMIGRFMKP
jgi:hypothetical protein